MTYDSHGDVGGVTIEFGGWFWGCCISKQMGGGITMVSAGKWRLGSHD